MYRTPRFLPPALALAAVLVTGACSGDPDGSPQSSGTVQTSTTAAASSTQAPAPLASSTTTTATVRSTATTDPDAELLVAVRSFWDLFIEIGGRSGPFDAQVTSTRLAERTTGEETATLFQYFQGNAAAGYVVRGDIELAPVVVSNDGSTATVRDCYDDRTGVYRASDGVRIDTDNPARHRVLMTLLRENGVWKVAAITDEGDGCVVS